MGRYEDITAARALLGLNEAETLGEVKRKINTLLKAWHPDTGVDQAGKRREKTEALLNAKKVIMEYCDEYKISFAEDEVKKYLPQSERWMKRFGGDHVWGENE